MPRDLLEDLTADGGFRAKVAALVATLAAKGESAKVFEARRTEAQQAEKVRLGYSKTMASWHLKRGSDGGSLAADVADSSKGWNASRRFWLLVGANCQARGLSWGGLFGLSGARKAAVSAAIGRARKAGWPAKHEAYQVPIGWDPAHVSLGEKAGAFPQEPA